MKQVRLILWKDVRQFWWHLAVYALLLAAFGWASPKTWPGNIPNGFLGLFVTLLKILLMASQFVLITSAIHADRLVGEEQFWITRPYTWQALMAGKCRFVLTCVVLPYVLMQWWLLHVAGLNPFAAKAGMASSLLRFAVFPCLSSMLIASVTENLAAAFTFVTAVMLGLAGLLQFILSGTESIMSPPYEFQLFGGLFGILLLAILSYQFARRRTAYSRIAIAATLAFFLLFIFGYDKQGFGAPVKELIRSQYEVPSNGSPQLVFASGPVPYEERGQDLQYLRDSIEIKLPIRLEGLPPDARIRDANVAVTLTANGMRYATPWQNASVTENAVGFPLPKDVLDRFAAVKTALHIELIAVEMRPVRVQHVAVADRFRGPSNGRCIRIDGRVFCRYAYQQLVPTHVEGVARSTCDGPSQANPSWTWLLHVPPGTRVDPVVNETVALQGNICSGAPLAFTEYGSPHRFRLVIDVPTITLRDFRAGNR